MGRVADRARKEMARLGSGRERLDRLLSRQNPRTSDREGQSADCAARPQGRGLFRRRAGDGRRRRGGDDPREAQVGAAGTAIAFLLGIGIGGSGRGRGYDMTCKNIISKYFHQVDNWTSADECYTRSCEWKSPVHPGGFVKREIVGALGLSVTFERRRCPGRHSSPHCPAGCSILRAPQAGTFALKWRSELKNDVRSVHGYADEVLQNNYDIAEARKREGEIELAPFDAQVVVEPLESSNRPFPDSVNLVQPLFGATLLRPGSIQGASMNSDRTCLHPTRALRPAPFLVDERASYRAG